jgi:hypothetical protein
VDGHHRVEHEREIDSLGLAGELKGGTVTVERPGPFTRSDGNAGFVSCVEKALLYRSVRKPEDYLHSAFSDGHDSNDGGDETGFETYKCKAGPELGELHGRSLLRFEKITRWDAS